MNPRERLFLRLLVAALAAAVSAIATASFLEAAGAERNQIRDYRGRAARLSNLKVEEGGARTRLARITSLIERAELRRSAASRLPVADFGREVMGLLAARGIEPGKYLVVSGARGEQLELSLKCKAVELLSFLQSSTVSKNWSVPYLSLRSGAEAGAVEAVVRLGR